ncbi:hypothetical protein PtB15_7B76 [Puccinia triticina]|nr:hypothetical protein PtB15_7B76 [Puccinia triticina]
MRRWTTELARRTEFPLEPVDEDAELRNWIGAPRAGAVAAQVLLRAVAPVG